MYDVIIVGAGASGLVCAIVSAQRGKRVLVLEKNNRVGKKLLATGNGRCNITNQRPTFERFHSQNPKFIIETLDEYNYQSIKQFFRSIGIELIEAKEAKVFPMSLQASTVVDLLEYEAREQGVNILCDSKVERVEYKNSRYKIIHSKGKGKAESKKLVIATGHQSSPQLGGVEDGVIFAKRFGHNIVESSPSLVQLTSSMPKLKYIAGVKVEGRVKFKDTTISGDILFTNYGISGLAILDISRLVVKELKSKKEVVLTLDLMPKMSNEQLFSLFKKSLKKAQKPINIWLEGFMNKKLVSFILEPLGLKNKTIDILIFDKKLLKEIIKQIKSFEFTIDGSRGFQGAEVAMGGVDTRDINPKTMESKIQKGLYLIGEVLDIDGDRGGFNLHFAWVSGIRAGESV
ncbi:MAG: NAD(P)/FAD-dependent oxidoreductase [Epsilonproteobacteria bacterium]|nr:NAD(P)/FAD-dependent oxidoreductase [Campylobacterota bacterium]